MLRAAFPDATNALLASPMNGEREAAMAALQRIVSGSGLSWEDIIPEARLAPDLDYERGHADWRALATTLLRSHGGSFNDVEIDSLLNVPQLTSLSVKQHAWLGRFAEPAGFAERTRGSARAA